MQRRTWLRVDAPKAWRPRPNEELIGIYLGSTLRGGQYGEYRQHFVKSRAQIFYASGAILDNLFSLVTTDTKVKLVFKGVLQGREHPYKLFELYTEDAIEFTLIGVA